ncbi:MAG: branched-chain amino acid ABC transporter permease [Azoarcus sp.]|nr:branched-chain amino acid ABC transporter permease [Azoarcus sp.]
MEFSLQNSIVNFLQQCANGLEIGSFYALIALGYSLVYGVLRLINFAHGDVFMVGAYLGFFISTALLAPEGMSGLSPIATLILAIPLTMIFTSLLGVSLERVAYRPLMRKGAHRLYVVITALMCGLILQNGNVALLGASHSAFPELVPVVVYDVWGVNINNVMLFIVITAVLVFLALHFIVSRTRMGMAMRAVSWDKFALPLMGIPLNKVIVFTFVLGSAVAGLGGFLHGMSYPVLEQDMGASIGWKAFIAAVVGGIGEVRGAFVGAFLLAFVETMVNAFLPSTYSDLFAFSILLLILWHRPTGIFGRPLTAKI